jgi:hypothetical protein
MKQIIAKFTGFIFIVLFLVAANGCSKKCGMTGSEIDSKLQQARASSSADEKKRICDEIKKENPDGCEVKDANGKKVAFQHSNIERHCR